MAENNPIMGEKDYILLKDFKVETEVDEENGFILCFWVYIFDYKAFPSTIIKQVFAETNSSSPLLVLNEKTLMLLPLTCLHNDAPGPGNTDLPSEVPKVTAEIQHPQHKWIHVGYEVTSDFVRLYVNGELAGELLLSSLLNQDFIPNGSRRTLIGVSGDSNLRGFIHDANVFPSTLAIKDQYVKDPPLRLSIDESSISDIEEDNGFWNIVGGKASCRRIFSLDVALLNAFGQPVNNELEVVASLLYAHNRLPVEKTNDEEPPLLVSCDGIEFASSDRPSKLSKGRASFKLKISKLSSKCDNRQFCIKFGISKLEGYRFLEDFSPSIRCISRNRTPRTSTIIWKKISAVHPVNGSQTVGLDYISCEPKHNTVHEAKLSPTSKRVRLGEAKISKIDQHREEYNSIASKHNRVENGFGSRLEARPENFEEVNTSQSDSESTGVQDPALNSVSSRGHSISDVTTFRYCLGGLTDRSILLKEIATTISDDEISGFADQVSVYSGCSHHRHQIKMAKRLIDEGTIAWNSISQSNLQVQWESAVFEIEEQFMKIACCTTRSLSQQDFELLRKIAGCQDYMAQENFEKMWCWLYPVALTLSSDWIKAMWNSTSPKWIEGFITKEEAELSLQGPRGLQEPGTFILRFPTSRSWPHPDAGSLVVTYVGSDYALHHRLLSLDNVYSSGIREMNVKVKPLQDMLFEEPELTRLGSIMRRH
ncbi:SH2 domain protein A, putative isoform 2 [Hibiscus syriacus]|uniref:SH2 domain protein A, putative isoform 2 n=1 Tax=Hibiscus syriacus TaxID=106335 RepID=A0A6A2X228_HIBSY|nr:SH2 domain-containing protein A-like [Hibiscus syriacus]KAE8668883.1 SH2 domain protein A, putative isoform 2 [Hibiscus syriacus]